MDLLESLDVPFDTVLIRRLLRCSLAWARVARKEREQMRSIFALGARPARPGIDQLLSSSGRGGGPGGRAAGGVGGGRYRSLPSYLCGGWVLTFFRFFFRATLSFQGPMRLGLSTAMRLFPFAMLPVAVSRSPTIEAIQVCRHPTIPRRLPPTLAPFPHAPPVCFRSASRALHSRRPRSNATACWARCAAVSPLRQVSSSRRTASRRTTSCGPG